MRGSHKSTEEKTTLVTNNRVISLSKTSTQQISTERPTSHEAAVANIGLHERKSSEKYEHII